MKKVIRKNCFETNSSSQHSIVITKNDKFLTTEEITNELWNKTHSLYTYSEDTLVFGRYPFRMLHTVEDKTWFVIASYCSYKSSKDCKAFIDYLTGMFREVYPDFGGIKLPTTHDLVYLDKSGNAIPPEDVHCEYLESNDKDKKWFYYYIDDDGNKIEATKTDEYDEFPFYGSIDHQSLGLLQSFLKSHNITIKDFIFNQKYHVVIDGDEYCIFDDMWKYGVIDRNTVSEVYPYDEEYGIVSFDTYTYNKLTGEIESDT